MVQQVGMVLLVVIALVGRATEKTGGEQLARVAKDWSLSIRASQVIPEIS